MNDLIEAYKGVYEDDLTNDVYQHWKISALDPQRLSYEDWVSRMVTLKIKADTPARRLEIYCEWNGILGYSSRLYKIATGEL